MVAFRGKVRGGIGCGEGLLCWLLFSFRSVLFSYLSSALLSPPPPSLLPTLRCMHPLLQPTKGLTRLIAFQSLNQRRGARKETNVTGSENLERSPGKIFRTTLSKRKVQETEILEMEDPSKREGTARSTSLKERLRKGGSSEQRCGIPSS